MDTPVTTDAFQFERFRLDRRGGGLSRRDDNGVYQPVALGSRALDVLCVLVARPGELVSRDEIMSAAWPDVSVEEHNLVVQISALRRILDAERTNGSCIQTASGRGYRFVAPVIRINANGTTPRAATTPDADGVAVERGQRHRTARRTLVIASLAGGLLLVAVIVAGWHFGWFEGRSAPPRLSIVVLPFANLSGDRSEDYLAEAITDDLTSDLSRLPGMFVIARQSAYAYQGKTVDVRKVGDDLGVRYVLEGSVRRLGDHLRVNAQFVATETGAHLWADRFDQQLKDLSAGQEEIVRRIGHTLHVAMMDVESTRSQRERPTNPDAFDLILRARSISLHPMGPREHSERIAYERALRLDPTSILAMTGLADELILDRPNFGNTAGDALDRAANLIASAAAINPNDPRVLGTTALLLRAQDRYSEAIAAYQRVLHEDPNAHYAYSQIGMLLIFTGRSEEALPAIETAIRRDPRGSGSRVYYANMGLVCSCLGETKNQSSGRAAPLLRARTPMRELLPNIISASPPLRRG